MRLEYHILAAFTLDLIVGDPRWLPHPVRLMGRFALALERPTRAVCRKPMLAGMVTALAVIGVSAGVAWGLLFLAETIHPWAKTGMSVFLIYTCLAARDLAAHSGRVGKALRSGDLPQAQLAVSMMVSRDTDCLDEAGATRGAIESVAENMVDGVAAPLLFAIVAGPVGAITFKAISTLDSTFGYKNEQYRQFGWASARIDDVANWLPARLTAPLIALAAMFLRFGPLAAMRCCLRDHGKHASPNSAWAEATVAGALGVQLGGPTRYAGVMSDHPTLGDAHVELSPKHIGQANRLMYVTTILLLALGLAARWAFVAYAWPKGASA